MKTPKKTGSKPETRKPSDEGNDSTEDLNDDAKSDNVYQEEDDFDEIPLDEIDSFDDFGTYEDDDDF